MPQQPTFLYLSDLKKRYRRSAATIYRWIKNGTIPPGHNLGQSRVWRETDLLAFEDKTFGGTV